jgi:hypothetical protein
VGVRRGAIIPVIAGRGASREEGVRERWGLCSCISLGYQEAAGIPTRQALQQKNEEQPCSSPISGQHTATASRTRAPQELEF